MALPQCVMYLHGFQGPVSYVKLERCGYSGTKSSMNPSTE